LASPVFQIAGRPIQFVYAGATLQLRQIDQALTRMLGGKRLDVEILVCDVVE